MRFLYNNPISNPCHGCTKRAAGCAVNCESWADYVSKRNQYYENRRKQVDNSDRTKAARNRGKAAILYTKISHKK